MSGYLTKSYQTIVGKLSVLIFSLLVLLSLAGCEWVIDNRVDETPVVDQGSDEMEEEETEEPPEDVPADVVITVTVLDETGSPLSDVAASSAEFVIETEAANEFAQFQLTLTPNPEPGMIVLSKPGYVNGLLYLDQGDYSQIRIATLMAAGEPILVDGFTGGSFSAGDGAAVEIEPEALMRADGSVAAGDIELYITPVNTNDLTTLQAFPGSFLGAPEDIDFEVPIYSYGVVNMSFYQDGEKLQLRDGYSADLTLPMYASQHLDGTDVEVGDSVPFWILDEETGVWEQNGEALVVAEPLSPSGFALNPTTTHFSWFNVDAWGAPGSNPGGSNGGGSPTRWCRYTADVFGVEIGERLALRFSRYAIGSPSSSIGKFLIYEGNPIESVLPSGTGYSLRVGIVDTNLEAEEFSVCANGEDISVVLDLDPDGEPEFFGWDVSVTPVFSYNATAEMYEILDNKVTFGGSFARDENDRVFVNAPFMLTPVELTNRAYFDELYLMEDESPTTITAQLDNENGSTTETTEIEFIDFASPIVKRLAAYNRPNFTTEINWEVQGADSMAIYLLSESPFNPNEVGLDYFPPVPEQLPVPDDEEFITNGLDEYEGYIRITFSNQYGDTHIFRYLSPDIVCPPFSELCSAPL